MSRPWTGSCFGILLLCPASHYPAAAAPPGTLVPESGVVVEEVDESFAAYEAGLRPGDVLLGWERSASPPANAEPASGAIDSPFDLREVEIEQAPRGELTLSGTRGGKRLRMQLPPGMWKLRARPRLGEGELETYEVAAALLAGEEIGREGEDNGLLQAWEIFEQVRIDAELVTLSACDTGLGKVLGGEGLLGLTRAFQYAGARSVFASLWSVSDESTGELMQRFYGYLKAGQSKAEALRSAQLDLLRGSRFTHPFHWAGFQLVGDWR